MTIGRIDINEKDLPKICGAIIQLEERADAVSSGSTGGSGGGGAAGGFPGGRLTLQTATPVMTTTQSAKTSIYYTPYNNSIIACYDGTNFTATTFSELSNVTTNSSTGSAGPAAVAASSVYDLFVWSNGGTLTLTRGPAWSSDTARSAGTALVMVSGLLMNSISITNGPAASRGTYVGTVRSNASSQIDWTLGTAAANGGAAFLYVWNAYNRVDVGTKVSDTTASWSYSAGVIRPANNQTTNRISFVSGLAEDVLFSHYACAMTTTAGSIVIGVGLDSTTVFSGSTSYVANSSLAAPAGGVYPPQLGAHFVQALEWANGATTFTGDGTLTTHGINFMFRM